MDYFYIVIEVQMDGNGTKSVVPVAYDNKTAAESAAYTTLSYAVASTIPYHAVIVLRSDGAIVSPSAVFDRRNGVAE